MRQPHVAPGGDGRQDEPVALGRSGLGVGVAALLAELVALTAVARLGGLAAVPYLVLLPLGTAALLLFHFGSVVHLERDALVVVTRGRRQSYAWSDVLEVSWRHEGGWSGSGPVLRTRGGAYDQPGPNMPAQVAQLPIFGRRARRTAVVALRAATLRHGVPYSEHLERDIAFGRRRPRLPSDDG